MDEVTKGLAILPRPSYVDGLTPSSDLADRFGGVAIPHDATTEQRQKLINAYVEVYHLLERMGWYEHTSDWDFHIGVKLYDGRQENHFGDGADVMFVKPDGLPVMREEKLIAGIEEPRTHLRIETMIYGEGSHPFDEFRVEGSGMSEQESVWLIPIDLIHELGFGYCT